jgi:UDP-glucuronate 4-epimerase
MGRVLLTGGAGFIGSHLLDALVARGDDVVIVDDFNDFYDPATKRANLRGHAVPLHEGDIRDEALWARLPPADLVLHLAGRAGVRPSLREPELYRSVNVDGTANALAYAEQHGAAFVLASSSSIYGDVNAVPFREDATPAPVSPYGQSKAAAERLAAASPRAVALRFFTVYGPRQRPDLAIHRFTRLLLLGRPLPLFGDGRTQRDYTHVDDLVRGVLSAADALLAGRALAPVYNLGSDRTIALSDLVARLEAATGRRAAIEWLPDQEGDVRRTWADLTLSARDLGYAARVDFDDGLRDFVRWIRR